MVLYCDTNKYKDSDVFRTPGPIKSMKAVLYLSKIHKYSMKVGGGSSPSVGSAKDVIGENRKNSRGDRSLGEVGEGIEGSISMEEPSAARPQGLKKRKLEEKVEMGHNASPGVWVRWHRRWSPPRETSAKPRRLNFNLKF